METRPQGATKGQLVLEAKRDGTVIKYGKPARTWPDSCGYLATKYHQKKIRIHRFIAETFIPNPLGWSDVNHKNGNKQDNRVENLEWCSRTDNLYHALRNGLHANPETPIRGINVKTGEVVAFESQSAARRAGFTQANISKVIHGERPQHKGYRWEYA